MGMLTDASPASRPSSSLTTEVGIPLLLSCFLLSLSAALTVVCPWRRGEGPNKIAMHAWVCGCLFQYLLLIKST